METLIIFPELPIGQNDLRRIEDMVRSADLICTPGKRDPRFDFYSVHWYHTQHALEDCKIRALFDLNLTHYLIDLIRGKVCQPCHRLTSALMTLLILSDILIEPGIGLVESSKKNSLADSDCKLREFRIADNLEPTVYADIALGRLNTVTQEMLPQNLEYTENATPNYTPSEFVFYKGYLLKMLQLLRDNSLSRIMRIKEFWYWMWAEYQIDATSATYANILFSETQAGMLNRDWSGAQLERNMENISWDLALVRNWIRRVAQESETGESWLLCSNDKVVRLIADGIFNDFWKDKKPRVEWGCFFRC